MCRVLANPNGNGLGEGQAGQACRHPAYSLSLPLRIGTAHGSADSPPLDSSFHRTRVTVHLPTIHPSGTSLTVPSRSCDVWPHPLSLPPQPPAELLLSSAVPCRSEPLLPSSNPLLRMT